jgi:hypothetical protein
MFDAEEIGKTLGQIAHDDDCTVEEAFQRAVALYREAQLNVWGRGFKLGVLSDTYMFLGFLASGASVEPNLPDPNFEIDLD